MAGLLDAVRAAVRGAARTVVHAVLDDVFAYLAGADLTGVLTSAIDLDRVLASIDLDAVLARLDLDAVLARVDLNRLLASVDLNALLADVDLNRLLAGVDVDAVLDRTDLVGVAEKVVDGVDLNSIVREASATVSTEVISDVRSGSERADDGVEQFVNRVLRRGGR